MAGYASPSLAKMEASHRYRSRPSFSFERILGDPFALATISIAIMAWLIAFVAGIISTLNPVDPNHRFPQFAWWGIAYYVVLIVCITLVVALDLVYTYHVMFAGALAYGLYLSTSAIDNLIYFNSGAYQASAAGFLLLSVISFVWLYYFGSQTTNGHAYAASSSVGGAYANGPSTGASRNVGGFNQYGSKDNSYNNQAYNTGGRLHGLETSSPEIRYPDAPSNPRMSPSPQNGVRGFGPAPTSPQHANNPYRSSVAQTGTGTGPASTMADESVSAPTEYPYRARAIYSYDANPDDANEISFAKHEILEISDVSGRWWQARKQNGDTGIAPSNYLILL